MHKRNTRTGTIGTQLSAVAVVKGTWAYLGDSRCLTVICSNAIWRRVPDARVCVNHLGISPLISGGEKDMKVEVYFIGESIDVDTYEGKCVSWIPDEGYLHIYVGESLFDWESPSSLPPKVASYPEGRVVRVKVVE